MPTVKTTDQLEPTLFVIFGGAGDLTWRTLIPALFDLSHDRSLPAKFAIIAVDRMKLGDLPLRRRLRDGVNPNKEAANLEFVGHPFAHH